jgi:hypothetical protein
MPQRVLHRRCKRHWRAEQPHERQVKFQFFQDLPTPPDVHWTSQFLSPIKLQDSSLNPGRRLQELNESGINGVGTVGIFCHLHIRVASYRDGVESLLFWS